MIFSLVNLFLSKFFSRYFSFVLQEVCEIEENEN